MCISSVFNIFVEKRSMDRKVLCEIVKDIRQKSGVPMKTICATMDVMPTSVYRLESGTNNFNLKLLMNYLNAINARIVLSSANKSSVVFSDYEQFIDWLIQTRTQVSYTQRILAEKTGITHVTIANIESKKNVVTIDYFLKIIEVLNYELNIESI